MNTNGHLKAVFGLVERCHTGLSDLFPHEGTKGDWRKPHFYRHSSFPCAERLCSRHQESTEEVAWYGGWEPCGFVLGRSCGLVGQG